MINEIYKDITTVEEGIIAHGVNCQKAMGAGVAKAIINKWPEVYDKYMMTTPKLGTTTFIQVGPELLVANCYTQEFCGSDGKRYASPGAIQSSLSFVYDFADESELSVNLPQIGSALGGLDWETEVLPIITDLDNQFENVTTNLYIWG